MSYVIFLAPGCSRLRHEWRTFSQPTRCGQGDVASQYEAIRATTMQFRLVIGELSWIAVRLAMMRPHLLMAAFGIPRSARSCLLFQQPFSQDGFFAPDGYAVTLKEQSTSTS